MPDQKIRLSENKTQVKKRPKFESLIVGSRISNYKNRVDSELI
jgi:hypothetical protein